MQSVTIEPDLHIVIVSYNTVDLLRKCLKAIPDSFPELSYLVSVVDNCSSDGSPDMVESEFPKVRLIRSQTNLGFAGGNNLAISSVRSKYVVLLNPDTEPHAGSLHLLTTFLDDHKDVGVCGPMLLNTDGSLQANGRKFPTVWREFLGVTGLRRFNMAAFNTKHAFGRDDLTLSLEVDEVSGACLMVRGEIIEALGALDDRFFMFYEEIEFCHRVKAHGWKVWFVAEAKVVHHWMGSVKREGKKMTNQLFKSQIAYYKKTSGPMQVAAIYGISYIGMAKNGFVYAGVAVKRVLRNMGILKRKSA